MTKKFDVGTALEKLRGSDEPRSRMTILDEKNKALEEEIRRLRAERLRLERENPSLPSTTENQLKRAMDALDNKPSKTAREETTPAPPTKSGRWWM
jgi:hypothetical protein